MTNLRVEKYKKSLQEGRVGRPKGIQIKLTAKARDKMQKMIGREWKPLIKTLISVAQGEIAVLKTDNRTGAQKVYKIPPDAQTGQFLISTVIGKAPIVDIESGDTQPIYNINITKIENNKE